MMPTPSPNVFEARHLLSRLHIIMFVAHDTNPYVIDAQERCEMDLGVRLHKLMRVLLPLCRGELTGQPMYCQE